MRGELRGSVLVAALVSALLAPATAAEPERAYAYRKRILGENLNSIDGDNPNGLFNLVSRTVPGIARTKAWSVKVWVLHGGKQEGVALVIIDNGAMTVQVVPARGMGVLEARAGDVRLGWDSPVKEVVHPSFINLEGRGGLGWLEGFSEGMVRCGLEYAGHPGLDEFVDNTGAKAQMNLTLHGKIANIPASKVEVLVDKDPPHRIRVRGTVHERLFFGPKLELTAEVSTVPGSTSFRVEDAVTNRGASPQEFQLIYHTNYGGPVLEKGATVLAPVARVAPMNETAAKGVDAYATYEGPTPGFIEQVYLIHPLADAQGRTSVLLQNAAKDKGASITWSARELPYLTVWKNTSALADGYVTGLEPATGFPYNRKVERAAGRVPKLAPGETRRFALDFGLHTDKAAVADAADRILTLQKGHAPQVESTPPAAGH
jgi:hypothetical protein